MDNKWKEKMCDKFCDSLHNETTDKCYMSDRDITHHDWTELEVFIESLLAEADKEAYERGRKETEIAFGGCLKCYGKGYHTTIDYASGGSEFDLGGPRVSIHKQNPVMRYCSCDRGNQLKSLISHKPEEL